MTVVHIGREAVASPVRTGGGLLRRVQAHLDDRRCTRRDEETAAFYLNRFYAAVRYAGLVQDTWSAAGIQGERTPVVTSVVLGPAPRLFIRPLPGQLLADFEAEADRIAAGLGVAKVRFLPTRNLLIRCDLIKVDPLAAQVDLPAPARSIVDTITLGLVESGELLRVSLADIAHLIIQGATRSGKSRWTYGLLSQVAGCPDLIVAGSDITGILLRPFTGTRHADWIALGGTDLEHHVEVFEGLADLMHQRHERIPPRLDVLPITDQDPLILAVIEEYGVLVDVLGAYDTQHKTKLQPRFRAAVRAILAGGAKVGFRVLLITQRADASGPAGVGSFERGQAAVRLSFRVDTHDAVKLLHPSAPKTVAEEHAYTAPGVALLSGPELPLARLKAPTVAGYGDYVDSITAACPPV